MHSPRKHTESSGKMLALLLHMLEYFGVFFSRELVILIYLSANSPQVNFNNIFPSHKTVRTTPFCADTSRKQASPNNTNPTNIFSFSVAYRSLRPVGETNIRF